MFMTDITDSKQDILSITVDIVTSYVSNNSLNHEDLQGLIERVYATLETLGEVEGAGAQKQMPAVPVQRSVTPDYLICLEDGKKLKMLKRHLRSTYGMSPDEYREKWGLPANYPMVAPGYAEHRRVLAKKIGLGKSKA